MEETAKRVVTKIEANPILANKLKSKEYLRVAAYCRVSTDSEDQLESYKAQVSYYTDAISKNPKWRFAGIYADEGITGTQDKKRPNFLRMIKDCNSGKIDLILTKSVARFARNTVDSLKYVRKLKGMGVGVYFEEQALDTLKTENEMAIGLYSVLAQAESENISANVRWGIRQRMKSGTYKFRYDLLGYKKGENGEPVIVEDEAKIIREIFNRYINGNSIESIKRYLEENNFLTKQGNKTWSKSLILKMLKNEKYCGDLLMQKTYIENCITKKSKVNNGELPKYLISNNHPAIIERTLFNAVQKEIARRSSITKKSCGGITQQGKYSKYLLSEILVCGECGSPYRRYTHYKNGKKRVYWRCINKTENKMCTRAITVEENLLKETVRKAIGQVMETDESVLDLITANLSYSLTGDNVSMEIYSLEKQIKEYKENIDKLVKQIVKTTGDGHNFLEEIQHINERLRVLNEQLELKKACFVCGDDISSQLEEIKSMIKIGKGCFDEYDERVLRQLVDCISIYHCKIMKIVLKGGYTIEENIA